MQIFKRVNKAQNIIEFVFIMPIVFFIVLSILEVGLFWQDVNAIYSLNNEINANVALVNINNPRLNFGDACPAATRALEILEAKDSIISLNNPTYQVGVDAGSPPFARYMIESTTSIMDEGQPRAQIVLWVDCRNPYENGITTQLEFYHKMLVMKASIPTFSSAGNIEIIPDTVFIRSPLLNTIRHY